MVRPTDNKRCKNENFQDPTGCMLLDKKVSSDKIAQEINASRKRWKHHVDEMNLAKDSMHRAEKKRKSKEMLERGKRRLVQT
jgi:hypothetical protein